MDAQLESLVELYLTRGGKVFVSPQYDIPFDKESKEGGACPDLLALDIANREVVIVEVTSASNLDGIIKKVKEREQRWFRPIRRRLLVDAVIDEKWKIRFLGFVRRERVSAAKQHFADESDVCFFALEDAAFSFAYWEEREKGLPK